MTSSARDVHYGRRGGGWAEPGVGQLGPAVSRALKTWRASGGRMVTTSDRSHPDTIARARAHAGRARTAGCPAADSKRAEDCTCRPAPDDLDAVWAGRARMAAARTAAGKPLDPTDVEALARSEHRGHPTRSI